MNNWILDAKLQFWIRVARRNSQGNITAFEYAGNTVAGTRDAEATIVPEGSLGFRKLMRAYFRSI